MNITNFFKLLRFFGNPELKVILSHG